MERGDARSAGVGTKPNLMRAHFCTPFSVQAFVAFNEANCSSVLLAGEARSGLSSWRRLPNWRRSSASVNGPPKSPVSAQRATRPANLADPGHIAPDSLVSDDPAHRGLMSQPVGVVYYLIAVALRLEFAMDRYHGTSLVSGPVAAH